MSSYNVNNAVSSFSSAVNSLLNKSTADKETKELVRKVAEEIATLGKAIGNAID